MFFYTMSERAVARLRWIEIADCEKQFYDQQDERNFGKISFSFSRARARWLIRFFTSGSSSAIVLPNSGTEKIGS